MNKSKRMVGIISLGDVSHSASSDDLLSECVRSISAHSLKHGARDGRQAARSDLETMPGRRRMHPNMGRDLAPPHSITRRPAQTAPAARVMLRGD